MLGATSCDLRSGSAGFPQRLVLMRFKLRILFHCHVPSVLHCVNKPSNLFVGRVLAGRFSGSCLFSFSFLKKRVPSSPLVPVVDVPYAVAAVREVGNSVE